MCGWFTLCSSPKLVAEVLGLPKTVVVGELAATGAFVTATVIK